MPLWLLEQIRPWEPIPPDAATNAQITKIVVRAPDAERARSVATAHLLPTGQTVRGPGETATMIASPFADDRATTCEELEADGDEGVIVAEVRTG